MTCHVRQVAVLLLAGLAATVFISWALAAWGAYASAEVNRPPFAADFPPLGVETPGGWDVRTWVPRRGPGLRHDIVTEMEWIGSTLGMMEGHGNQCMERAAAGWPIPCLQWAAEDDTKPGPILRGLPIPVPHRDWPERRLPLKPLWGPFAIDVLACTGVAAGARTWFVSARGNRRVRRGLCAWCAYPVGGASVCSECGRAARLRESGSG